MALAISERMDQLIKIAGNVSTVGGLIQTALGLVAQVHNAIATLGLNEKLRNELCRKVKQLEGILQCIETTAHDTNDELMKKNLKEIKQDLEKCLKECERIKQQILPIKLLMVDSDHREIKDIHSLLTHSMQILHTHLAASNYSTNADGRRNLRELETVVRNPQAGYYRLDSEDLSVPEIVRRVSVKEVSPGVLQVNWADIADVRYYELEYDQQNGKYFKVEQEKQQSVKHKCLLDSTKIIFPNKFGYSIRIRAVNGRGPGEWSECVVGKFTILPSPPRKPLAIRVNSSTSVLLVVEKPPEEEGVKPVTHYVVEYHRLKEKEHGTQEFAITDLDALTFQGKSAYEIDLKWNIDTNPMPTYLVKISLRNPDGVSKVYQDDIIIGNILPSEPIKPEGSEPVVYTNTDTILIRWKKPETNAYVVHHYEIHWGKDEKITKIRKTENCYAVFRELESWQRYRFKVRAVNRMGIKKTEFLEISAVTDSKAGKVAKAIGASAGAGAAATLITPFTGLAAGVAAGVGTGAIAAVSAEDKGKAAEVAAGTAAGIGGGAVGLAAGVLLTPLMIIAAPFVGIATVIGTPFAMQSGNEEILKMILQHYPDDSIDEDLETTE